MINQIYRHIYDKDGVDFTVLDLTGASGAQVDEVFKSLDRWASNPEMRPKSRLIIFMSASKAVEVASWLSGVIERMLAEGKIGPAETDRGHAKVLIRKLRSEMQLRAVQR